MSDTTILLIRHADVHNPDQIVYGRLPRFRLSEDGLAQAAATARALAHEAIAAIYTSPMLRARQTANAIARQHPGIPVRVSRFLQEIQTSWQGTPWAEIGADQNLYEPLLNPGDETMEDVADRMELLIRRLARRHEGQTVACVSHGDPIAIAKVRLQNRPLTLATIREPEYPERASVTRLVFHPEGAVDIRYESPAQHLIKPYEYLKKEAPAEASGEQAVERSDAATAP